MLADITAWLAGIVVLILLLHALANRLASFPDVGKSEEPDAR